MKRLFPVLISVFLFCILAVSCSEEINGRINLKSLKADDRQAMETFGDINSVFGSGRSRGILTPDRKPVFLNVYKGQNNDIYDMENYVVVYNDVKPEYVTYIETVAPEESSFQKGHYEGLIPEDGLTYVEYSSWRRKDTGEIYIIDIRVAQGDFYTKYEMGQNWFAKSIQFDPLLRYDLTRGFEIETMNPINIYDPTTGLAYFDESIQGNTTPSPAKQFNENTLEELFMTIAPDMSISYRKSENDQLERRPMQMMDGRTFYLVSGTGICSKESITSTVIERFIDGEKPVASFRFSIEQTDDFNPEEQYLFEITCTINEDELIEYYDVRLQVSFDENDNNKIIAHNYNSEEEFNKAFSAE